MDDSVDVVTLNKRGKRGSDVLLTTGLAVKRNVLGNRDDAGRGSRARRCPWHAREEHGVLVNEPVAPVLGSVQGKTKATLEMLLARRARPKWTETTARRRARRRPAAETDNVIVRHQ
jgi:hypothetical protein